GPTVRKGDPASHLRSLRRQQATEIARLPGGTALASATFMSSLWQDLRFSLRVLARAPGYALVVALTLAVGIGANTAIFSVVRGVLWKPLPYREPAQLVRIYGAWHQFPRGSISAPEYFDYRAQASTFSELAVCETGGGNL